MGYRSDVQILASKKVAKQIFKVIKKHGNVFDDIKVSPTGNTFYFSTYCKWYDDCPEDYPDVCAIRDVLCDADEKEYYFVREGEEDGDIDRDGSGWMHDLEGGIDPGYHDECIDTWDPVDGNGKVKKTKPLTKLEPFWKKFKEKAELLGVQITVELKDIAK